MDQPLEFSFCQGNSFPDADQLESPKPMPRVSELCIGDADQLESPKPIPQVSELFIDDADQLESPKPVPRVSELCIDDADQLESPKPVPRVSELCIDDTSDSANDEQSKITSVKDIKIFHMPAPRVTSTVFDETTDAKSPALEQSVSFEKPKQRVKVPFEKGYSQMDWMKLTQTKPDLAGLKGQSNRRLISKDEVKQHQSEGDTWTVLKGCVYNISPYMKFHPGGVDMLMKAAGKDCTALFNKYHAWVNAEFLLEKCLVGILDVPV